MDTPRIHPFNHLCLLIINHWACACLLACLCRGVRALSGGQQQGLPPHVPQSLQGPLLGAGVQLPAPRALSQLGLPASLHCDPGS